MKKRNRILITSFFIAFSLSLGILFAFSTWNGKIFFHSRFKTRAPSSLDGESVEAIPQIHSYTINKSSEETLLKETEVNFDEGGIHLSMGHFLLKDETGAQELACNVYNKIEVLFHSGDMAISGSPVVMKILSPCRVSNQDMNQIESLYIPLKEIYLNHPSEGEFIWNKKDSTHQASTENSTKNTKAGEENKDNKNAALEGEDQSVKRNFRIFFENVGFTWPSVWYIESIRFYDSRLNTDELNEEKEINRKIKEVLSQNEEKESRMEAQNAKNIKQDSSENLNPGHLADNKRKSAEDAKRREPSSKLMNLKKSSFPDEFKTNSRTIQKIRKNPLMIQWKKKKK